MVRRSSAPGGAADQAVRVTQPAVNDWRLRPGYRENFTRQTWEGQRAGAYWHPQRTALSSDYQLDVYLRARHIALEVGAHSVMDVGSGPGMKAARLFCDVLSDVVLVDQPTTERLVAKRCPSASFVAANLEEPSIDLGRTFDLIVCADVIEHLLDPAPCLRFIQRHAAPDTWIVLSTPERDYARGLDCLACDKPEHVREWNGFEFVEMLAAHGFHVVRQHLCPTLRPEEHRGDIQRLWLEPFEARAAGPGSHLPDRRRSCQVCECQTIPQAAAAA